MLRAVIAWLVGMLGCVQAVGLRVATFNIGAHFAESYFDYSLGDPGTLDHESVKAILARINADVVALQEIHSVDIQGGPDDLDALAAALGYPHLFVTPHTSAIDTSLRVAILSRYPFLMNSQVTSPAGAKELTRLHPVVKVDVPGTAQDPIIASLHFKSGTLLVDRFRRAVEMTRLVRYLESNFTNDDNFIILGDFNPSSINATFSQSQYDAWKASGDLSSTYTLGADISFPLSYFTTPTSYFASLNPVQLDPRQLNGSIGTFLSPSSPRLDLILMSPSLAGRPHDSEVYHSQFDTSNTEGLPKSGNPLSSGTSATASDHLAVFADVELDGDLPNLDLLLSRGNLTEGSSIPASVLVRLPATRASAVTVSLTADDASAVTITPTSQTIPAGSTSCTFTVLASARNFLIEGERSVTLIASATAYDPDTVPLHVLEIDKSYALSGPDSVLTENFDGFLGTAVPDPWLADGSPLWFGTDDGSSSVSGLRSYGSDHERALGFLVANGSNAVSVPVTNTSSLPLTALEIGLDVEQWRATLNGAPNKLTAEVVVGTASWPVSGIDFTANRLLPTGAIANGVITQLNGMASGFSIPPGASFELRFKVDDGNESLPLPADVFINEFHYDNTSNDTGEFIEVAVGPGYSGSLADTFLVLYDGSSGGTKGTHALSTFTAGALLPTGHRLYHRAISLIENGPDGFAIVSGTSVLQFISYEGSFTATSGPAAGLASVNVGVSQSGSDPVGQAALGLRGSGSKPSDFTWTKFTGIAHSPGQANADQSFVLPVLAPQGIAIDNLSLTFLVPDHDEDGITNAEDPDDDNDGMSDVEEIAFGSDPLNAQSRFSLSLARSALGSIELWFPGASGIIYTVQESADLTSWQNRSVHTGGGSEICIAIPSDGSRKFFRIRVAGQP
jgi:endonuclease/exonuclease/phosphatase family metal-dependent hydrolase